MPVFFFPLYTSHGHEGKDALITELLSQGLLGARVWLAAIYGVTQSQTRLK